MTEPLEYAFISSDEASKDMPLELPSPHAWCLVSACSSAKVALDPSASILLPFPFFNDHGFTKAGIFDWLWTEVGMNVSVYKNRFGYYCVVRRVALPTCQLVVSVVATTARKVEVQCKLGTYVAFKHVFAHDHYITCSSLKEQCKHCLKEEGLVTNSCALTLIWSQSGKVIPSNQKIVRLIVRPNKKVAVQRSAGKVKVRA